VGLILRTLIEALGCLRAGNPESCALMLLNAIDAIRQFAPQAAVEVINDQYIKGMQDDPDAKYFWEEDES